MARYIKIENGTIHAREVASHETQLIAELLAYGWVVDDNMATMAETLPASGQAVRAAFEQPPMTGETIETVDPALANAATLFPGEWPVGLPPEWFGPLKDKFGTPDAVMAATTDELLALPGATHYVVALIRRAFLEQGVAAEG